MRLLLPRRADQLASTSAFFEHQGFLTTSVPLLHIETQPVELLESLRGIVLTSSAAVPALPATDLPVYCVGPATARVALARGLRVVYTGRDNATTLATELAARRVHGPLLHPCAENAPNGWLKILEEVGCEVFQQVAYTPVYLEALPDDVIWQLQENQVSWCVVFSLAGGQHLRKLFSAAGLKPGCCGIIAFSPAVATAFHDWPRVKTARSPQLEEVLYVLEQSA